MAKGKSKGWYRRALVGDKDNPGLRSVARGFSSSDGFIIKDLTPSQKRKITKAWHDYELLTAQPRYIYKPTGKGKNKKLKQAQQMVQEDTTTNFKVAFIPYVPKKLKNGKLSKPRITFGKKGIKIQESTHKKIFIPLNPPALVKNPQKEITQAIKDEAPKAQRFSVQAAANEMGVMYDKPNIVKNVIYLMNKYDGKKQLLSGRHKGDGPKQHNWRNWLHGINAYEFPKVDQKTVSNVANIFADAKEDLQRRRRNDRKSQKWVKIGKAKKTAQVKRKAIRSTDNRKLVRGNAGKARAKVNVRAKKTVSNTRTKKAAKK